MRRPSSRPFAPPPLAPLLPVLALLAVAALPLTLAGCGGTDAYEGETGGFVEDPDEPRMPDDFTIPNRQ